MPIVLKWFQSNWIEHQPPLLDYNHPDSFAEVVEFSHNLTVAKSTKKKKTKKYESETGKML